MLLYVLHSVLGLDLQVLVALRLAYCHGRCTLLHLRVLGLLQRMMLKVGRKTLYWAVLRWLRALLGGLLRLGLGSW